MKKITNVIFPDQYCLRDGDCQHSLNPHTDNNVILGTIVDHDGNLCTVKTQSASSFKQLWPKEWMDEFMQI